MRSVFRRIVRRLFWRQIFNIPQMTGGGMIWTLDGFIELRALKMIYLKTKTPAGWSYAKEYYRDGRLVRRDVTQDVERGLAIQGRSGIE